MQELKCEGNSVLSVGIKGKSTQAKDIGYLSLPTFQQGATTTVVALVLLSLTSSIPFSVVHCFFSFMLLRAFPSSAVGEFWHTKVPLKSTSSFLVSPKHSLPVWISQSSRSVTAPGHLTSAQPMDMFSAGFPSSACHPDPETLLANLRFLIQTNPRGSLLIWMLTVRQG